MKASPSQDTFNAGEFSEHVAARVRFEKYKNATKTCENMIPMIQGGLTRREGTMFVHEVKTSSKSTRLIEFEFSVTQAYVIEFGDLYLRFYKDRGQIITSGVSAWVTATAYAVGALVTNGGNTYYCITAHTSGATFAGDSANWYQQTGTIYEIPMPYVEADLFELKVTQSADVLYITHPDYAPRKLSRTGHTSWVLSVISFQDGPYLSENATTTTLTLSATSGSVTVTASADTFVSTDVGRLVRFKSTGATWGWLTITAYSSATSITATVNRSPAAATASTNWRLGLWSATTGYPSCVTFFEDRLFFAGNTYKPQRLDGSVVGDYENLAPSASDGVVADDNALAVSLNANDVNLIRWMIDDEKGLLIGTVSGEWLVRPSSLSEAMTPTNITAKRSTAFGSANLQAIRTGKASIYVQRSGQKVRELAYVYQVDGFQSPDMNVLAGHVLEGGVKQFSYQQEPHSVVWFARNDGQLIGMTYDRDQDVVGWHRHILGGVFGSGDAVVESVAVIPTPSGDADEVWLIVKRTINGATKRYVEYITPKFNATTTTGAFFVDCGLTYTGAATSSITGLDHLEGQTISTLVNGATHPDVTVASGGVTLTRTATTAHFGFGYNSNIETLKIEAGAADGTAQAKTKRIHRVAVRLFRTLGLKFGPNESNLDILPFRTSSDTMGNPPALYTGDKSVEWNNGYDSDGVMYFRQDQPLPFTLLGVYPQLVTQDR